MYFSFFFLRKKLFYFSFYHLRNLVLIFMLVISLHSRSIPVHSVLHSHTLASPPLIKRSSLQDFPLEMAVLPQLILLRGRQ